LPCSDGQRHTGRCGEARGTSSVVKVTAGNIELGYEKKGGGLGASAGQLGDAPVGGARDLGTVV